MRSIHTRAAQRRSAAGLSLALLLACGTLQAAPPPQSGTTDDAAPSIGSPLDPGTLEELNTGTPGTWVHAGNDGNVGGNTATGVITGDNTVDGGAFANAAGINTVIQNSGANVLIQNGTAVNVQFVDPRP